MDKASLKEIIEQLDSCAYQCEGGPLHLNTAFIRLQEIAEKGPEHLIGDRVWFHVKATANGVELSQWIPVYVHGIGVQIQCHPNLEYTYNLGVKAPHASTTNEAQFTAIRAGSLSRVEPNRILPD